MHDENFRKLWEAVVPSDKLDGKNYEATYRIPDSPGTISGNTTIDSEHASSQETVVETISGNTTIDSEQISSQPTVAETISNDKTITEVENTISGSNTLTNGAQSISGNATLPPEDSTISGSNTVTDGTQSISGNATLPPEDSTISGSNTVTDGTQSISGNATLPPEDNTISGSNTMDTNQPKETPAMQEFTISSPHQENAKVLENVEEEAKQSLDLKSTIQGHLIPFAGHYHEVKNIAEGGMGIVKQAQQQSLMRDVAIKRIKGNANEHRFLQESLITASLEHPHIVPIHELAVNSKREVTLVMKKMKGLSWKQLLHPKNDSEKSEAEEILRHNLGKTAHDTVKDEERLSFHLNVLLKVCDAVAFAHENKVIHNDLKPENIMVGEYGEVVVMDWGIAVSVEDHTRTKDDRFLHSSQVKSPMGTPCYMPVELAEGDSEHIGNWTDVYLLGGILYEIIHGHAPHQGSSVWMVLLAARNGEYKEYNDLSQEQLELKRIYSKALHHNYRQRYQRVLDFKKEIEEYFQHRDSLQLTTRAMTTLEKLSSSPSQKSYNQFDTAISMLRNAQELWPENSKAQQGEYNARQQYAETALANEDLGVVEAQMETLKNVSEVQSQVEILKQGVRSVRSQRRKKERRNRFLAYSLYVAILAIIGTLATGFWLVREEKKRTEQQRDFAQAQERIANERKKFAEEQKQIAEDQKKAAEQQKQIAVEEKLRAQQMNVKFHREKYVLSKQQNKHDESLLWLRAAIEIEDRIGQDSRKDKMTLAADLPQLSRVVWRNSEWTRDLQLLQVDKKSPIWVWGWRKPLRRGFFHPQRGWALSKVLPELGTARNICLWRKYNKLVAVMEDKLYLIDDKTAQAELIPTSGAVQTSLYLEKNHIFFIIGNELQKMHLESKKIVKKWLLPYAASASSWDILICEKYQQALIMSSSFILYDMEQQKALFDLPRGSIPPTVALKTNEEYAVIAYTNGTLSVIKLGKPPKLFTFKTPWPAWQIQSVDAESFTVTHEDAIRRWSFGGKLLDKITVREMPRLDYVTSLPSGLCIRDISKIIIKDKIGTPPLFASKMRQYVRTIRPTKTHSYIIAGDKKIELRSLDNNQLIRDFAITADEALKKGDYLYLRQDKKLINYHIPSQQQKSSTFEVKAGLYLAINTNGIIAATEKGVFRFSEDNLQRREMLYPRQPQKIIPTTTGVYFIDINSVLKRIELWFYSWKKANLHGPLIIPYSPDYISCYDLDIANNQLLWGESNGKVQTVTFAEIKRRKALTKNDITEIFAASGEQIHQILSVEERLLVAKPKGILQVWDRQQGKYTLQETMKPFTGSYIKNMLPTMGKEFLLHAKNGEYCLVRLKQQTSKYYPAKHLKGQELYSLYTKNANAYTKGNVAHFEVGQEKFFLSENKLGKNLFGSFVINRSQTLLAAINYMNGFFYVWDLDNLRPKNPQKPRKMAPATNGKSYFKLAFVDDDTLGVGNNNHLLLLDVTPNQDIVLKKKYTCIVNRQEPFLQDWLLVDHKLYVIDRKNKLYIFDTDIPGNGNTVSLSGHSRALAQKEKSLFIVGNKYLSVFDLEKQQMVNKIDIEYGNIGRMRIVPIPETDIVIVGGGNKILFVNTVTGDSFYQKQVVDNLLIHMNLDGKNLYWLGRSFYGHFSLPEFSTQVPKMDDLAQSIGKTLRNGEITPFTSVIQLQPVDKKGD